MGVCVCVRVPPCLCVRTDAQSLTGASTGTGGSRTGQARRPGGTFPMGIQTVIHHVHAFSPRVLQTQSASAIIGKLLALTWS